MLAFNRKRRAEFIEAQKQMESDSLEAARLAYMTNKATDEQIALVEEANARAGAGTTPIFKMPLVLGTPKVLNREPTETTDRPAGGAGVAAAVTWPGSAADDDDDQAEPQKRGGFRAWLFSSLKKEEEGHDVGSSQKRLGYESLSEEDDGTGVRDSDLVRAVDGKQSYLRTKTRQALDKEQENQRQGGPLDRVGLPEEKPSSETPKRKGWLW